MRIAILGGGPAGYEAALVAVELGAEVTLVERDGVGGACVLTDCVPSKALVSTAEVRTSVAGADALGLTCSQAPVDAGRLNARILALAAAQSADIRARLVREGVTVIGGRGRLIDHATISVRRAGERTDERVEADVILLALGSTPRVIPGSEPDGERVLNWRQVYDLPELPEHLIVVGIRRDGRGVRLGVSRARLGGDPRLLARPGAAR